MGRAPCCDKANVKKGPWSPEEDNKLKEFMEKYGTGGNWIALPHKAGLRRCGKSCRLRWLNYLRPNIKHGEFSDDEDRIICSLYVSIGSRWSVIAAHLPGRTDNDIKNYWNTKLKKKLLGLAPFQKKSNPQQQQQQQQQLYSSPLEATIAPTSSSPRSSFFTHSKPILTGIEPGFSITTDVLSSVTTSATTVLNVQDPMHQYQIIGSGSIYLMFGGEPSCSSSDGSCNQISYGKETEFEFGGRDPNQEMGWESLLQYNGRIDRNQNLLLGPAAVGGPDQEKGNGFWEEPPSDFGGFEDIKQLISSVNGYTNLLLDDLGSEIRSSSYKAQGRVMYHH